jgi:hypothetical protein
MTNTEPSYDFDNDSMPSDLELRTIGTLAARAVEFEKDVVEKTRELERAIRLWRYTVDEELPNAMMLARTSEFTTEEGHKIKLDESYIGSKLTRPEGLDYVEEHDGAEHIKTEIKIEFPTKSLELARAVFQALRGDKALSKCKIILDKYVHHSTIGAYAKSRIEAGDQNVPLADLGVTRRIRAKVGKTRTRMVELKGFEYKE